MAVQKLSAKSQELVEYLEALLKECDHFASLVEQYAAAKTNPDQYSILLSRALSQLRQKAMMRNVGFVADTAGQLSVVASRGGSAMMKSRMLRDGVASLKSLIERTIKGAIQADQTEKAEKEFQAAKELKARADAVKARVLAEEAHEAAKQAALAPPKGAPAGTAKPASGAVAPKAAPGAAAPSAPAVPVPSAAPAAQPPRPAQAAQRPGAPKPQGNDQG